MFLTLKTLHIVFALTSLIGFLLRALLMFTGSPLLRHKAVLIIPHIIDMIFLGSGFGMAFVVNFGLFNYPWLTLKVLLLMCYLLFVGITLSRGSTMIVRTITFFLALITYVFIVGVAISKSPLGWFA